MMHSSEMHACRNPLLTFTCCFFRFAIVFVPGWEHPTIKVSNSLAILQLIELGFGTEPIELAREQHILVHAGDEGNCLYL